MSNQAFAENSGRVTACFFFSATLVNVECFFEQQTVATVLDHLFTLYCQTARPLTLVKYVF